MSAAGRSRSESNVRQAATRGFVGALAVLVAATSIRDFNLEVIERGVPQEGLCENLRVTTLREWHALAFRASSLCSVD